MNNCKRITLFLACMALLVPQVFAHHSTRGIYHEDQTLELKGVVKEWAFVNPHPYLTLTVEDENGVAHDWDLSLFIYNARATQQKHLNPVISSLPMATRRVRKVSMAC